MKTYKLPSGDIKYNCICGKEMILSLPPGERPKRLIKCFECIEKETLAIEEIRKNINQYKKQ